MNDIGRRIATGAAWMVALKLATRLLGLLSTIILARLLMPSDFGLVAMATSLLAVVELLGAFSFQTALIQNQLAPRSHYDTAWTLTLLLSGLIGSILVLLAEAAADFYAEPRLENVIYLVALRTLVSGLENVGIVAFQKDLEFHREFAFQLLQKILGFAVVIPLAFYWRDYRALLAGMLASAIAGVVLSYVMHPFRPKTSLIAWRELLHFSKWLLLNNVIYVIRHRSADFLIGKLAGVRSLGVFTLSYEVSTLATTELAAPINRALLPGLARVSTDITAVRDGYFSTVGMIALLGVPTALGISATADSLIPALFGSKWADAVPIVETLALAGAVSILTSSIGGVCIALGKPRLLTVVSGIYVLFLLPMLFVLTQAFDIVGTASAFLAAAILSFPVQLRVALRLLAVRLEAFVSMVWRPITAAVAMYFIVTATGRPAAGDGTFSEHSMRLLLDVLIGAGSYVAILASLWWTTGKPVGAETAILNRLGLGNPDKTKGSARE